MSYTYRYPRPMVTVDMPVLRFHDGQVEMLLVQRDRPPFAGRWALTGGFIDMDERLAESARRELREETGLADVLLFPIGVAGDPGRDPRGRTITIVHAGILSPPFPQEQAGDDARKAGWFSIDDLPPLAFDHQQVVRDSLEELRKRALFRGVLFLFLPERFERGLFVQLAGAFLNDEQSADLLLRLGLAMDWIAREGENRFRRSAGDREILECQFARLQTAWLGIFGDKKSGRAE